MFIDDLMRDVKYGKRKDVDSIVIKFRDGRSETYTPEKYQGRRALKISWQLTKKTECKKEGDK